jgi:hypothetical protein
MESMWNNEAENNTDSLLSRVFTSCADGYATESILHTKQDAIYKDFKCFFLTTKRKNVQMLIYLTK